MGRCSSRNKQNHTKGPVLTERCEGASRASHDLKDGRKTFCSPKISTALEASPCCMDPASPLLSDLHRHP